MLIYIPCICYPGLLIFSLLQNHQVYLPSLDYILAPYTSAPILADLESTVAGKASRDHLIWTEPLSHAFENAQAALRDPKTITIPRPTDQLIITNDGAVRNGGIGSVLYIMRNGRMLLGGYFSAKLKKHQQQWLPCEVGSLSHFICHKSLEPLHH